MGLRDYGCFVFLALFVPRLVFAQVVVNEVAWMGTAVSTADEWLELRNSGNGQIDLTGWTLEWATDSSSPKVVDLSGTIASGGYYLLERTDDNTVPTVTADLVYTGALSNSGEKIVLRSPAGVVQTLDQSAGWLAGDNVTKETMQWTGSSWVTGASTPRVLNIGASASNGSGDGTVAGTSTTPTNPNQTTTGGGVTGMTEESVNFSVQIGKNKLGGVGVPVYFTATVSPRSYENKVSFGWSFGDGTITSGQSVHHIYTMPGQYVVVARASIDGEFAKGRLVVTVSPISAIISGIVPGFDGYITLSNKGNQDIPLDNFTLSNGKHFFNLPEDLILLAGRDLSLSARVTGLSVYPQGAVELRDPYGQVVSALNLKQEEEVPLSSVTPVEQISPERPLALAAPAPRPPVVESTTVSAAVQSETSAETPARAERVPIIIERQPSWLARFLAMPRLLLAGILSSL